MDTITHSCGHRETVRLTGGEQQASQRRRFLQSHPCLDCRYREAQSEHGVAPFQEGTKAQIVYASDVRRSLLDKLSRSREAAAAEGDFKAASVLNDIRRNLRHATDTELIIRLKDAWNDIFDRYGIS